MSLRLLNERHAEMDGYFELMASVEEAAAKVFAAANTEEEVCELERLIYGEINRIAESKMKELT